MKQKTLPALVLLALTLAGTCVSAAARAEETQTLEDVGVFGFGLESSGSVCCISVRFWVNENRGSEMVLSAFDTNFFVTLRGLQAIGLIDRILAYTGLGMTLRFGEIVALSPFSLFMAMQGFLALQTPIPYYESLTANVEASVELRPNLGFSTALGLGLHFYF